MQGFNMGRYVPPDQEGLVNSSGNQLHNRPRGAQKTKRTTTPGGGATTVPVVRFEMPFAVWCDGCAARTPQGHPVLIAQGVRFNAEKHRRGAYYSTPIWGFRMRHPACGAWLEIRTDPAMTSYVVAEGGRRRREYADDDDDNDGGVQLDPAAAAAASAAAPAAADDDLRARLGGLGGGGAAGEEPLPLLPATAEDARHAALIEFGRPTPGVEAILARPLFAEEEEKEETKARKKKAKTMTGTDGEKRARDADQKTSKPTRSSTEHQHHHHHRHHRHHDKYAPTTQAAKRKRSIRDHLAATVLVNTRLTTDPFLGGLQRGRAAGTKSTKPPPLKGVKRVARDGATPADASASASASASGGRGGSRLSESQSAETGPSTVAGLVSYDSE
ncbi:DUF455 domain containing protein [Niveomyces insectorum RCEF 264]|uniref:DUF455 domain containing protein n=1 Tax=Niveomyces insectorum RCEF 264 TaxID=1081102 RepID=A0A167VHX7_9HYPO|nr:DUF455 domain containing protein [Niveomyces insectorum RCEF 264]